MTRHILRLVVKIRTRHSFGFTGTEHRIHAARKNGDKGTSGSFVSCYCRHLYGDYGEAHTIISGKKILGVTELTGMACPFDLPPKERYDRFQI